MFAPVAEHPATEMALVQAYRELRDVSPDARERLARASARARDVVRLQSLARRVLEDGLLRRGGPRRRRTGRAGRRHRGDCGPRHRDRPPPPAPLAARSRTAGGAGRVRRGRGAGRRDGRRQGRRRGARDRCAGCARRRRRRRRPTRWPWSPTARTRIVTTSDADDEVRAAVRAADRRRARTARRSIASRSLYGSRDPYARLVHEQLDAAGIAAQRRRGRCRSRRGWPDVRCSGSWPSPPRGSAVPTSSPGSPGRAFRHQRRPVPVTAWERLSRDAGVVAGRRRMGPAALRLCRVLRRSRPTRRGRSRTPRSGRPSASARKPRAPGRCVTSCWV